MKLYTNDGGLSCLNLGIAFGAWNEELQAGVETTADVSPIFEIEVPEELLEDHDFHGHFNVNPSKQTDKIKVIVSEEPINKVKVEAK